ncbi:hypothetical protein [Deefgea salmonis]|uniref:Uncharacterized protein n=1 Tax=Deefgea salmonis TaxID=2875502 RepID=A0ABS8BGI8_9NEIS|nr:hypothetical protein [Deefgea salmonis]MCB5194721.1 hypothetical protein [Deefgea salmonis]
MSLARYNLASYKVVESKFVNEQESIESANIEFTPTSRVVYHPNEGEPSIIVELEVQMIVREAEEDIPVSGVEGSWKFKAHFTAGHGVDFGDLVTDSSFRVELCAVVNSLALKDLRYFLSSSGLSVSGMPFSFEVLSTSEV